MAVTSQAEDLKKAKYSWKTSRHIETSGVLGPFSMIFLRELGRRLSATTGDTKRYLIQRLSVAVQRGNAASILGKLIFNSHHYRLLVWLFCFRGLVSVLLLCNLYLEGT